MATQTLTDNVPGQASAWSAVLSMSLCVAMLIAAEFMPVSLLTPIADGLGASAGQIGQAISISGFFAVAASLVITNGGGTPQSQVGADCHDRSDAGLAGPDCRRTQPRGADAGAGAARHLHRWLLGVGDRGHHAPGAGRARVRRARGDVHGASGSRRFCRPDRQ